MGTKRAHPKQQPGAMVALLHTRTALVAAVVLVAAHGAVASGQSSTYAKYRDASLPIPTRVKDLLGRMTLEEKVAQLLHPYVHSDHTASTQPLSLSPPPNPSKKTTTSPKCTSASFAPIVLFPCWMGLWTQLTVIECPHRHRQLTATTTPLLQPTATLARASMATGGRHSIQLECTSSSTRRDSGHVRAVTQNPTQSTNTIPCFLCCRHFSLSLHTLLAHGHTAACTAHTHTTHTYT